MDGWTDGDRWRYKLTLSNMEGFIGPNHSNNLLNVSIVTVSCPFSSGKTKRKQRKGKEERIRYQR